MMAWMTFRDQNPASIRKINWPVAPDRRTRPAVSRTNRCAPRPDPAEPLRIRPCRISLVPARVASSGCNPNWRV
jgi:hypothetical protein